MMDYIKMGFAAQYSGWAYVALRVVTGLVFFMHGYQKLSQFGLDGVAGFLGPIGFPMPMVFAVLLVAAELLGGAAMILGLWTRLAAAFTSIVAIVALLTVHILHGYFIATGGFEFILLILASSVYIWTRGSGMWALDQRLG